jgi:hypothetical protein
MGLEHEPQRDAEGVGREAMGGKDCERGGKSCQLASQVQVRPCIWYLRTRQEHQMHGRGQGWGTHGTTSNPRNTPVEPRDGSLGDESIREPQYGRLLSLLRRRPAAFVLRVAHAVER